MFKFFKRIVHKIAPAELTVGSVWMIDRESEFSAEILDVRGDFVQYRYNTTNPFETNDLYNSARPAVMHKNKFRGVFGVFVKGPDAFPAA